MIQRLISRVRATNISQPDAVTCQSACIAMALNQPSSAVPSIRSALLARGTPGDPNVMGRYLRERIGDRYILSLDASISDCLRWIADGELLITHGWFTRSGHVICLDGAAMHPSELSIRFDVKDPWGEFDFPKWRYISGTTFYDGFYSARGIYAACVAGLSSQDAYARYLRGELDTKRGGMWVHRIKP
jgi:hypothetical protein